jgi:hypothetical protein
MILLAILLAVASMAFTIFCGIKYIHPGSHRGYADSPDNITWKETFDNKWWTFRDIPVRVNSKLAHFFRLWWWMATGVSLREWVSVHRHNHIHAEQVWKNGKPNSRIARAMLYPGQASNKELVESYSIETPDTWIDRNLYYKLPLLGPIVYLAILYVFLGVFGLIPWLAQMSWLAFWRSESVNGYYLEDFEWNRLFFKIKQEDYYK